MSVPSVLAFGLLLYVLACGLACWFSCCYFLEVEYRKKSKYEEMNFIFPFPQHQGDISL
ncbi:hypothetical protein SOVF_138060 [Spinacia oleracea]|nr:hypothetical protein SOVF_138060 [Spinacia oleracea]